MSESRLYFTLQVLKRMLWSECGGKQQEREDQVRNEWNPLQRSSGQRLALNTSGYFTAWQHCRGVRRSLFHVFTQQHHIVNKLYLTYSTYGIEDAPPQQ